MFSLIISLALLFLGYSVYGRITQRVFHPDGRKTPAFANSDGVDHIPIKTWKAFLIQLLNIAGTGPIFGALMGAVFGPVVFLWIVFGSILGGAVHDYILGMISIRHGGASIGELAGFYLGKKAKMIITVLTLILMPLVGTVFVITPASLLASLSPDFLGNTFWMVVIFVYYIFATILPIDKIIGRFYPLFGALLIIMTIGIITSLIISPDYALREISFKNFHPDNLPVWPFMFVTVACGAISGFHATQSPLVAKCLKNEYTGRNIFYGAMITEAVIALVWAAVGVSFYGASEVLNNALHTHGQSEVVFDISRKLLGEFGGLLAIIGVVICPITSGDTSFRAARLILAETFNMNQTKVKNRIILSIPLFAFCAILSQLNFDVLWRYFSWSNQTLATISLWLATAYLLQKNRTPYSSLLTALPATFMSAVCMTYILMAPEGFSLSASISYPAGIVFALVCLGNYIYYWRSVLKRK